MKVLTYKDDGGEYKIAVDKDNTTTVKHLCKGKVLFKKSYTTIANAKAALKRYCGVMPCEVKA